jgi:hypothetical protein
MYRWMKKASLALGAAAMLLVLFAASVVPGFSSMTTIEASTANQVEFVDDSNANDAPARRSGDRKDRVSGTWDTSDDGDSGFNLSGRRYRGD